MDLEQKYKKETGFDVGKIHDIGTTYYSDDYVEWLEEQLNIGGVSQQRELLLAYEEYRHSDLYNLNDGYEDVIERFIANNCG